MLVRLGFNGDCVVWQVSPCLWGICFRVCPVKAKKWLDIILHAIACMRLDGGGAQKMAGRLSWSTQFLFHKLGRAMIKAIFAQKTSATAQIGPRLLEALHWWCRVLQLNISETWPWHRVAEKVGRVFVDAASSPAYCAVVVFIDGRSYYTAVAPPPQLMRQLAVRGDKQITSLVCEFCRCHLHLCILCHIACAGNHCNSACSGHLC